MKKHVLSLFEAYGIELEYMLVDAGTLNVTPIADRLLQAEAHALVSDVKRSDITWSNELALHVIELKTTEPTPHLETIHTSFHQNIQHIHQLLLPMGARLLPTAMHPWMNPLFETHLWPHDNHTVYETFNTLFHCQGHGWSNLQSMHINLPFSNDDDFGRLHAAIRLVLPLLPALAASSPICEKKTTPHLDHRLHVYQHNCASFPSLTGKVIPEAVFSQTAYTHEILNPIEQALAPYDTHQVLESLWCNARGAIARFDRNSIEIRVIDTQESPYADLAIAQYTVQLLQAMCQERFIPYRTQQQFSTQALANLFQSTVTHAHNTWIENNDFLRAWGWNDGPCTARTLLHFLYCNTTHKPLPPIEHILQHGCLAQRILHNLQHHSLFNTYQQLAHCLEHNTLFTPSP
jgi:carboxylate-amine ligase